MIVAVVGGVALLGGAAVAQPAPPPPNTASNDYSDQANWLCWPGRDDACAADLTTTVVKADGTTEIEKFQADPNAPIDCFYVYPTVSRDPGMVSSMKVEPEERNVVIQQAARLRASCRLYAPMYRQFTLTALAYGMTHPAAPGYKTPPVGFNDVQDAWNYYLAHENHGRGVVLVGHSQGSGMLAGLVGADIYGKPAQAQLVSAILMGAPLTVEADKDTGGDLKTMRLCTSSSQLGCVINYSSFRETSPPPDNARFARPRAGAQPGLEAACTNPANLPGSWGEAKAYFGAAITAPDARVPAWPWLNGKTVDTPFVSVPGLITAECVRGGAFHYLAIRLHPKAGSPRANDIPGDIVVNGVILKGWGLHLIDANLFMGNLVDIVHDEGQAWLKKGK
jgi:hypothetical protein